MFRPLRTFQIVVDVGVAGVFGALTLWSEFNGWTGSSLGILASVLTCVLMAAALGLRRLSPELALGVAWIAAIVQMSLSRPPILADLAVFAVLYTSAAFGRRPTFWVGFGSAILGAVVITAYLFISPWFAGDRLSIETLPSALALLIATMFALLLAWTAGALVRVSVRARDTWRAQRRAEEQTSAEQERVRIARDMHDVVAHSLAVVIAQADGARYIADTDPGAAAAALGTISTTARAALADVRLLLTQLRHSQADGPQPTLADLEVLYGRVRAAGVALSVDVDPAPPGEPPAAVQLAVYRILQEALTNALRHGDGAVSVQLAWRADRVDLTVRNPARPRTAGVLVAAGVPGAPDAPRGHGLIGMRERAQFVGGSLAAASAGEDFLVSASIPIGGGA